MDESKSSSADEHVERVRQDYALHWLAILAVAAYSWQLHGVLIALAVGLGLVAAISTTNLLILGSTGRLGLVRVARWAWVVVGLIAVTLSGASIESV